ncbi:MAG: VWA domain-containing protein [Spirochaetaceae bacterium]|jgi:uncharacterized protein with von Willebrand factor type A (vWA) domain|nr:VWA domain-containing protein [Spirochaetaceae bacterium]
MTRNKFHSFVNFGPVGTRRSREKLSIRLFEGLADKAAANAPLQLNPGEAGVFTPALNMMLSDGALRAFCAGNPLCAELVTLDLLGFIDGAHAKMIETGAPYADERALLEDVSTLNKDDFLEVWDGVALYLKDAYLDDFNADFHRENFRACFRASKRKAKTRSFESVKGYFADKWRALIAKKTVSWEGEFIDAQGDAFLHGMRRRIENLKTVAQTLEPGTDVLGRLWNAQKGLWKKADYDVLSAYADCFAKDATLQALARALGRKRESKVQTAEEGVYGKRVFEWVEEVNEGGKTEVTGVHSGGDIGAALPSDLALLLDEDAALLFYKRWAEKKLLVYQYVDKRLVRRETQETGGATKKREAEGPFILCIDTSGSMRGDAERVAKSLVFALLKFALKEKRLCYLISFSTDIETLEISDLAAHLGALTEFLSMSFNGGSNAGPALLEALAVLEREAYRKADVVMVSDFIVPPLEGGAAARIKAAQANGTLFHGVLIGDIGDDAVNRALLEELDTNTVYAAYS